MTRRALFAALASLPFVGRFVRKPAPVVIGDWSEVRSDMGDFVIEGVHFRLIRQGLWEQVL